MKKAEKVDVVGSPGVNKRGYPLPPGATTSKLGAWPRALIILTLECCERLAYYTIIQTCVPYMLNYLGISKAQEKLLKTGLFNFIGYLSPFFWGLFADRVVGRKNLLLWICPAYALMIALIAASTLSVKTLAPLYFVGFFGMALCMGAIKGSVSPLGADQFNMNDPAEVEQRTGFFGWFFQCIQVGGLVASFFVGPMQIVSDNGAEAGNPTLGYTVFYFVACGFMLVAATVYMIGFRSLWSKPTERDDVLKIFACIFEGAFHKVTCGAFLNTDKAATAEVVSTSNKIEEEDDFENQTCWLDIVSVKNGGRYQPRIVRDAWQLTRLLPNMIPFIGMSMTYNDSCDNSVFMGEQMNMDAGDFWTAAQVQSIFDSVGVIGCIALVTYVIKPFCDRCLKWELSPQRRIYIGCFIGVIAYVVCILVENKRKNSPLLLDAEGHVVLNDAGQPRHDISVFWILPQTLIIALAEAFAFVGALEFMYREAPDSIKTVATGIYLAAQSAVPALIIMILAPMNKAFIPNNLDDGQLETYFGIYTALIGVACLYGIWATEWLYPHSGGSYEKRMLEIRERKKAQNTNAGEGKPEHI